MADGLREITVEEIVGLCVDVLNTIGKDAMKRNGGAADLGTRRCIRPSQLQ